MTEKRFILFDSKISQGVSRARNLGINFFQKRIALNNFDKYQYQIIGNRSCELFSLLSHQELLDIDIDYLTFLDSDDYLDKKAFEIFLSYAIKYSLDLVCAGVNRIDSEYRLMSSDYEMMEGIPKKNIMNGLDLFSLIKKKYFHNVCATFIDFNFFDKIKIKFINEIIYEDHCFGTELFVNAQRIMVIQDFLYNYVCSMNSITRPRNVNYDRLLLEYNSWKETIDNLERFLTLGKDMRKIIEKNIRQFYYPNLIQSFLKLTQKDKRERERELRKYNMYSTPKTLIMFNFPRIYNYFRKYKNIYLKSKLFIFYFLLCGLQTLNSYQ